MNIFTCIKCHKEFSKKQHLDNHLNKKIPCQEININYSGNPQNTPKILQIPPKILQVPPKNTCNYCYKDFSRPEHLRRHLNGRCKSKKEDDETKQNIFVLLLEKEKLLEKEREEREKQNNKINELQNQLTELTKNIKELTEKTNISKSNITNNNNTNTNCNNNINNITNIIIPSDKLAKFGKEDLSKITQNDFLKITNKQGYGIFMECAKLIYNNDSVNQTVYVADVSRKKAMIWDNKQWVLSDLEDVLYIIKEKIRDLYNINLDTMEDKRIIEDFEKRVQKYFDMLYDEYDEDKKDDKRFIKRVQNMQDKFEHNLIKWLFNIKPDVLKNYNDIREKVLLLENEKKENKDNKNIIVEPVINIIEKPKKRGRPVKS